jgi:hypothetical protein
MLGGRSGPETTTTQATNGNSAMLVKAFDYIKSSADKSSFLLACSCQGDECSCSDVATGESIFATILNTKAQTMTKPTSLIEMIRGASAPDRHKALNEIATAAKHLPTDELKVLNSFLADEVKAQAAKSAPKAMRLARLAAAAESDDPRMEDCRRVVASGLKRLNMPDMNACAESGIDVHDLDKRAKDRQWSDNERITLKTYCHRLGLVE